jgi:hypothetical protein
MNKLLSPLICALLTNTSVAFAADPVTILTAMDVAMSGAADQYMLYEISDRQPGKDERILGIEVTVKGDKRFTKFTAPSDIKGTKILVVSQTQMYVYLPAYKKIRRVASHVTKQGVMGTTFSNDDMALSSFSDKFSGKLLSEDKNHWVVEATAKSGGDAPYPKIHITIEKNRALPVKLEYHNVAGVKLKTETRTGYTCESKTCTATVHEMTDHTKNEQVTTLTRKKWKVNQGVKDKVFTKRHLQRAR